MRRSSPPVIDHCMQADAKPDFKTFARVAFLATWALVSLAGCQSRGDTSEAPPGAVAEPRTLSGPPAQDEAAADGRAQFASGNFGLAERKFREAVEQNPDDGASWIGLAAAYDNLKRFDLADRAYAQATRLQGTTLEILNNRGYSYMLRGDGARALADFRKALEFDPDNAVILNNLRLLGLSQRPGRTTRL